jgi:putative redox protein
MTTMHVDYSGELRTLARHNGSGATLVTDAPKDNQGRGENFSPTDLLATSLASCMLTIMGIKARALGVDLTGTACEVEKVMQASPRKVAEIKVRFRWAQSVPEEAKPALRLAGETCPVMLSLDPAVTKTLEW